MPSCDVCGTQVDLPYDCKGCGGTHCSEHRLPENHDCAGLSEWGDPKGTFDSGFDDSLRTGTETSPSTVDRLLDSLGIETGRTGLRGYLRGNATFVFLGLMWITFFAQLVTQPLLDASTRDAIFVLTPQNPEYVWTWFTSIFAHGGFFHIAFNSIVVYFFGRLVERYVGSRAFAGLFIASGALAGLGQIAIIHLTTDVGPFTPGVVGASGAGLALMGVLTVLAPSLRVFLFPIPAPVPIWVLTGFYAVISVLGVANPGGSKIANGAHLVGLLIGLAYGSYVKDRVDPPGRVRLGGGPGGPGGPGGRRRGPF